MILIKDIKIKENIILYLIITCIILQLFIVDNITLGKFIYSILVAPLAIYFFPIKPLLIIFNKKIEKKSVLYSLASGYIVGSILTLSAIRCFIDLPSLRTVASIFLFCNFIFFFIEASKNSNKHNIFLHFLVQALI